MRMQKQRLYPRVVTITNQKGGTGKSTLVALLAYALASIGHNVLLLDLDPQAHLSSFFIPTDQLRNMRDGIIELAQGNPFKVREVGLSTKGRVDIVPSGLNYIVSAYRGMIPSWDPVAIDTRIKTDPNIYKKYEYILCDTAPELFSPTIWGLYAADYVLVPINNEELSFEGVKLLMREVLPDVIMKSRNDLKVLGVVMVNVVKRITSKATDDADKEFEKEIRQLPSTIRERFYKKPVFNTFVYRNQDLRDLMYTPRRERAPLDRIVSNSQDLQQNLSELLDEFIKRVSNFEGLR